MKRGWTTSAKAVFVRREGKEEETGSDRVVVVHLIKPVIAQPIAAHWRSSQGATALLGSVGAKNLGFVSAI